MRSCRWVRLRQERSLAMSFEVKSSKKGIIKNRSRTKERRGKDDDSASRSRRDRGGDPDRVMLEKTWSRLRSSHCLHTSQHVAMEDEGRLVRNTRTRASLAFNWAS